MSSPRRPKRLRRPSSLPDARPGGRASERPTGRAADQPADRPAGRGTERGTPGRPTGRPAGRPAGRRAGRPAGRPTGQSAGGAALAPAPRGGREPAGGPAADEALPRTRQAFAVTAPGLAPLCAAELRALGIAATAVEPAGVAFDAPGDEVARANLWLRTATRVLVRLAEFKALTFADLERQARRVPWETVLAPDRPVRLRVTCRKSRLYHSDAVAQRVAEAILRRVGGDVGVGRATGANDDHADDDEAPGADDGTQLIVVRFLHDRCTVSADSSGALLHRRGYRQAIGKAPLRETLAAAMLLAAGYDGTGPLLDPLCGSGTIAIEAALLARRIAPGRQRAFAFQRWPSHDAAGWRALLAAADAGVLPAAAQVIVASDRDAGAVRAATANARRAGVEGDVAVIQCPLSVVEPPAGTPGWLVTNPPYGKRMGELEPLRDLWARLGQLLALRAPGWRVAVLAPDPRLAGQLRLPLAPVLETSNGGLPVRVLAGTVPGTPSAAGPAPDAPGDGSADGPDAGG